MNINGTNNSEVINGTDGDDFIDGLGGNDAIDGGAGNDRIVYDAADDPAHVTGGSGTDTLVIVDMAAPLSYNLTAGSFEYAERTQHDLANANSWSSLVTTYDSAWHVLGQDVFNDN